MKKKKIIKCILSIILIILQLVSTLFIAYSLILYKGVETFYRVYGLIILIYLLLFFSYLLLRSIKKKKLISFIIPSILVIILSSILFTGSYYLNKVYKTINEYSNNENMYYSSLITYDKTLNNEKDLKDKKIGIVNDKNDIEGNILPLEVIDKLKLEDNNKIIKYDSTMELLYALKNKEVDAGFFSSNYIDMFYSMDGFENIEEETKVLYKYEKEYKSTDEEIKNETASLNKPFSMLFIGVDSSNDGVTSGYNADVLLLVTFNPSTLRATLTSIPRDMYLKTACSNGLYRRINTTTWGSSSSCVVQTVENLFDVDIDYYAKINFKGVVNLVDAVGGIDVDVNYAFCEQNSSRKWGKNTVFVDAGMQHLNGEQALALARNRHKPNDGSSVGKQMAKLCPDRNSGSRNDYQRGKNQMKVIMGIVNAATKINDPNKAIDILEKIKSNFQTNITSKDVMSLYNLGKSLVITDSTNLVNVQRLQLSGYNVWGKVYDSTSKSYPAVTIPYKGSINDIKNEIKANLNNSKITAIKNITFDLNNLYKDTVLGQDNYSESSIATLKSLSGYSVSEIKSYASENGIKVKFVDVDTKQEVTINDWSEYSFYSQKEHKDIILDELDTITINVKKKLISVPSVDTSENNIEDTSTENKTDNDTNTDNNEDTQTNEDLNSNSSIIN